MFSIPLMTYISHTIKFMHLKHTVQWVFIYSQFCDHYHNLIYNFYHPQKSHIPISSHSPLFLPMSLANTKPFSVSVDLFVLNISHKYISYKSYNMWSFVTSFFHSEQCLQGSFILYHISTSSFSWLNNIPLYGYITFFYPLNS